MRVGLYNGDAGEWDSLVRKREDSTFFHQMAWKSVIQKTYGHQPLYLAAREDGKLKGVLPLFLMRHLLFGRFLISVPFGDYGGVCADTEDAASALLGKAVELAQETRAKFLELRHIKSMSNDKLLTKTSRATLILPLKEDPQLLWDNLKPKVRNQVRKAENLGLETQIGDKTLLGEFYDVFAYNMRDLGTPVHSFSLFENVMTEFPEHTMVILVKLEDRTIGGAVVICFKDTMEIPWASSLREFFPMCPNNLLYWKALEYGCLKGYRRFSFGRSPWESGTFRFKKQWGAEPVQLHYQYYVNDGNGMPDYTPSTTSRFNAAIWLWRKLPISLTKVIGPRIISGIPY